MQTVSTLFERELRKAIDAAMAQEKENICMGGCCPDYASYRQRVGLLQGLKQALDLCEETSTLINRQP
jgi:hypothetical protein